MELKNSIIDVSAGPKQNNIDIPNSDDNRSEDNASEDDRSEDDGSEDSEYDESSIIAELTPKQKMVFDRIKEGIECDDYEIAFARSFFESIKGMSEEMVEDF
jgi:hypothetical protein